MSRWLLAIALGAHVAHAAAHDTWLVPHAATAAADDRIVELTTGHDFPNLGSATRPERVSRAELITPDRSLPLVALTPKQHVLPFRVIADNTAVLVAVVSLHPNDVALAAESVAQYVNGELGSEPALLTRYESQGRWRERYTKNAKTLIRTHGSDYEAITTQPHGLAFELVPSTDPTLVEPGRAFEVCAYARGRRVVPMPSGSGRPSLHIGLLDSDGEATSQRVDPRGCVQVQPKTGAGYLLRSVLIVPVEKPDIDWESHFTALTVGRAVIPSSSQRSHP